MAPGSRLALSSRRPDVVLAVLLLGQGLVSVLLTRHAGWWLDDHVDVGLAAAGDYARPRELLDPVFGHLAPGHRLLVTAVQSTIPGRNGVVVATTLLWLAVGAATVRLLSGVGCRGWRRVVIMLPFSLSPLRVSTTVWWVNTVHVVPCLLGTVIAIDGALRFGRRQRARDLVVLVAGFLLAAAFLEKALLIVPLAILASVWFDPSASVVERFQGVLRRVPLLITLALLSAGYLVVYLSGGYGSEVVRATPAALLDYLATSLTRVALPALWGLPGTEGPDGSSGWVAGLAALATAAIIVIISRRFRGGAVVWVGLFGAMLGTALVAGVGRVGLVGVSAASRDATYFTDDVFLVVLALAAATRQPRQRPLPRPAGDPRRVALQTSSALVGATVFTIASCASAAAVASAHPTRATHDYHDNLLRSTAVVGHGASFLYDTEIPGYFLVPGFYPYNLLSRELALDHESVESTDGDGQGLLATLDGTAVPASFHPLASSSRRVCLGGASTVTVSRVALPLAHELPASTPGDRVFVRLVIDAAQPGRLRLGLRTDGGVTGADGSVSAFQPVRPGRHTMILGVQHVPIRQLLVDVPVHVKLCVISADVGRPEPTSGQASR